MRASTQEETYGALQNNFCKLNFSDKWLEGTQGYKVIFYQTWVGERERGRREKREKGREGGKEGGGEREAMIATIYSFTP